MEIWPLMVPHTPDLPGSWKNGSGRNILGAYVRLKQEFDRWGGDFSAVIAYTPGWQTRNITLVDPAVNHRSSEDFTGFGHHYRYDPPGSPDLSARIIDGGKRTGMPAAAGIHGVDHAVTIPLFFLLPDGETPVVPVSQSLSGVRQASLLGETLRNLDLPGSGRILLLMSGVWSQNPKEMAMGMNDRKIDGWADRILHSLIKGPDPDWNILPDLTREVLDRMDPPGRMRELHLLKGLGAKNAKLLESERAPGILQVLISFDPILPTSGHGF